MYIRNKKGQFTTKVNKQIKIVGGIWLAALAVGGVAYAVQGIANFGAEKEIVFQKPVMIETQTPVKIVDRPKREVLSPIVEEVMEEEVVFSDLTEEEQIILDVFGLEDYKVARAVAKAESGLNCEAINVNTNGTIDYGSFQLNSVHFERFGGLKNLVTCEQQVKAAYELYLEQGWNPWVVFNTGRFKGEL
jgi:hypothetical protein